MQQPMNGQQSKRQYMAIAPARLLLHVVCLYLPNAAQSDTSLANSVLVAMLKLLMTLLGSLLTAVRRVVSNISNGTIANL